MDKVVKGYSFQSLEDANLAKQELKKIEFIEARLDYNNPNMVAKVYEKAVFEEVFKTPVGYEFLKKLYDYLKIHSGDADVTPIPLKQTYEYRMRQNASSTRQRVKANEKKSNWPRISLILNIILVIAVIFMFYIASTGENPNILNYERTLVNKYASWEQEISDREKAVKAKEKALISEQEVESGSTE